MDPADFGAMVIAPGAPVLGFSPPCALCAAARPRFRTALAAGLALAPCLLTVRFAARCAGFEPAYTARSYAWPDAYACEVPLRKKPYPLRKGRA